MIIIIIIIKIIIYRKFHEGGRKSLLSCRDDIYHDKICIYI